MSAAVNAGHSGAGGIDGTRGVPDQEACSLQYAICVEAVSRSRHAVIADDGHHGGRICSFQDVGEHRVLHLHDIDV